jgi:hypothetical protein
VSRTSVRRGVERTTARNSREIRREGYAVRANFDMSAIVARVIFVSARDLKNILAAPLKSSAALTSKRDPSSHRSSG